MCVMWRLEFNISLLYSNYFHTNASNFHYETSLQSEAKYEKFHLCQFSFLKHDYQFEAN